MRNSYRWQKKREAIKERDHHLCVYCLAHNELTYEGLEVHHVVPIEEQPELAYDDDYLITLCEGDHEDAEAGKIPRGELLELVRHPSRGVIEPKRERLHTTQPPRKIIYSQNENESRG